MTIIFINENFFWQTINILSVAGRDNIEDALHNTTVSININRS